MLFYCNNISLFILPIEKRPYLPKFTNRFSPEFQGLVQNRSERILSYTATEWECSHIRVNMRSIKKRLMSFKLHFPRIIQTVIKKFRKLRSFSFEPCI